MTNSMCAGIFPTFRPASTRRNLLSRAGQVRKPLSVSVHDLMHDFEPFEIAAVNQCSGNSRGLFSPRVLGAQWHNGAMGNALWRGVRLRRTRSGRNRCRRGRSTFSGLDTRALPQTPNLMKSLALDRARRVRS